MILKYGKSILKDHMTLNTYNILVEMTVGMKQINLEHSDY